MVVLPTVECWGHLSLPDAGITAKATEPTIWYGSRTWLGKVLILRILVMYPIRSECLVSAFCVGAWRHAAPGGLSASGSYLDSQTGYSTLG